MRRFLQFALLLACAMLLPSLAHAQQQPIEQACPAGDTQIAGSPSTTTDPTTGPLGSLRFNLCLEPNGRIYAQLDNTGSTGSGSIYVVYASSVTAVNSNLTTGGGTDGTAALQTVLNEAPTNGQLVLVIDGPVLVAGLNVSSNTAINCINGAGFYLKSASNREVLRNVNRSKAAITDHDITVGGCYVNANGSGQSGVTQPDNTPMEGLGFYGVNNITLNHDHVYHSASWSVGIGNATQVDVEDLWSEQPASPALTTDGIDLRGPITNATIRKMRGNSGDDLIALNSRAYSSAIIGPFIGGGNITSVLITDVYYDNPLLGIDLISDGTFTVSDIQMSHLRGTTQNYELWINVDPFNSPAGPGSFTGIALSDDYVLQGTGNPFGSSVPTALRAVNQATAQEGSQYSRAPVATFTDSVLRGNSANMGSDQWGTISLSTLGVQSLPVISSHTIEGSGSLSGAVIVGRSFSQNQSISGTLSNIGSSSSSASLALEYNPLTEFEYRCVEDLNGGSNLEIWKTPGASALASTTTVFMPGDTLTFTALPSQDGSSVTLTCKQTGSVSASVSFTDSSSQIISGSPGILFSGTTDTAALSNIVASDISGPGPQ